MWWIEKQIKVALLKKKLINKTIIKITGEGCQARNEFQWMGKVIGFKKEKDLECAIIEILLHNFSYSDARSNKEPETYTYPIANEYYILNDIQNIKGSWVLFS